MMHGEYKMPGGKLIVADVDVRDGRLANVEISGDFFLDPDTALATINATLEGLPADTGADAFTAALSRALATGVTLYGVSPAAIAVAVGRALEAKA
ncbi:MAG TPA: biotin--protein ligase [Rhodanobacteraceae bacterium]